jgi:capsular polysaccharide transport system permease protein
MASIDGSGSEPADSREVALRRGSEAAQMLRRAARLARDESLPVSALPAILRPRGTIADGKGGWFSLFVRLGFVVIFLIPALLTVVYFTLIASNQYASEFRFAVRGAEVSALDPMGAVAQLSIVQDTLVITGFMKSRALVERLDKELNLRAIYSRDGVDVLSALPSDASIEKLVSYWKRHLKVSVETISGLVTVEVYAFTPDDALAIAEAASTYSEDVVNEMTNRATTDLVQDSEAELRRAEELLKSTRAALQSLRNAEGTLDPDASAVSINELISALKLDRAKAAEQLATMSAGLSPSAPQLKPVRARIAALDAQIAQLEAEVAGGSGEDLSQTITAFDKAQLENEMAERRYAAAIAATEAARLSADRRRVYITPFVEPSLPQEAVGPLRFWYSAAGVIGSFFAWALLAAAAGFIRQRMS